MGVCMKGYFHISSSGLRKNDIFKTKEDFKVAMNDIALSILGCDVALLCFCLMSNHFHFVLYGERNECLRFAEKFKHRCAVRMRFSAQEVRALKKMHLQIDELDTMEYLENVIAYVLRNPLTAGVILMPYHYPWSSARLYFSGELECQGRILNGMSGRKRFGVLKSRMAVPDHYAIDENGVILPSCYVDAAHVERIFRHPSRLMLLLAKKLENDVELKLGVAGRIAMTDQEVQTQMNDLIKVEFGVCSISQLSMEQRIKLCLLLKRNFNAGIKQIARVTRLDPELVSTVV